MGGDGADLYLLASDSRARVTHGGFFNTDGSNIWSGAGFESAVGASANADQAISLSVHVGDLLPGDTDSFRVVYALDDSAVAAATAILVMGPVCSAAFPGAISKRSGRKWPPLAVPRGAWAWCFCLPMPLAASRPKPSAPSRASRSTASPEPQRAQAVGRSARRVVAARDSCSRRIIQPGVSPQAAHCTVPRP